MDATTTSVGHGTPALVDASENGSDWWTAATGVPRPSRTLTRVAGGVVLLGCVVGATVMVPRFAALRGAVGHVADANLFLVLCSLVAVMVTTVGSSIGVAAASGSRNFRHILAVETAASAMNRLTPAGLGSLSIRTLYLSKRGTPPAEITAILSAIALVGGTVHGTALVVASLAGFGDIPLPTPDPWMIALGFATLGLGIAATAHTRPDGRLRRGLRHAKRALLQLAHDRRRSAMMVVAAISVTFANTLALMLACLAVGLVLPFVAVASTYVAGRALSAAAPTPNGLGATEAALIAGLVASGGDGALALAGVTIYRMLSYWLPIMPGLLSARYLQRRGVL